MSFFNNFNILAQAYQGTDQKLDKQYSILPTVLRLVGDPQGKTVLDIACGSGFFSFPIAERGAKRVIGIDNAVEQLVLAIEKAVPNTKFDYRDIFEDDFPLADVALLPFAANYALDRHAFESLLLRTYRCLNKGGHAVFVFDVPSESLHYKQTRALGALKYFASHPSDGARIINELYSGRGEILCRLFAYYYSPKTIQFALQQAGFRDIRWHKPDISEEGLRVCGEKIWQGYREDPGLSYVTALK